MIRDYAQKNNVIDMAFLITEMTPIDKRVLQYAQKHEPVRFLDNLINQSTVNLRQYLRGVQERMARKGEKAVNKELYS